MTNGRENTILSQQSRNTEKQESPDPAASDPVLGAEIVVVVGPTATGKTSVAIELAQRISGEIVNADSMQVYRYMDIGTAKPGALERESTSFHLLDVASPDQQLTVAEWKTRAEITIAEIHARGNTAILCGGTGLYVKALLNDWKLAATPADPAVRAALQVRLAKFGPANLHAELVDIDAITASRLHPNDGIRIVRALEVYYSTGRRMSEHQAADRSAGRRRAARQFGLTLARAELHDRIDRRVDDMLAAGLQDEVRWLLSQGYAPELGPMRSLGYKEMVQYINHRLEYVESVQAIKQNTRRYAKRQQTWFHADATIEWIDVSALNSATVASHILTRLENSAPVPRSEEKP